MFIRKGGSGRERAVVSSGMVATAAAEQCYRGTEDLPSQPTGCRVQSISTERKVVGLPPISLLPQKLIKGIIPAVERFHTLWVPKKINTTVSVVYCIFPRSCLVKGVSCRTELPE